MTKAVEEQLRSEVDRLSARVIELKSSWSYRISAPIRLVERAVASLRKRTLAENLARACRGTGSLFSFRSDKSFAAYQEWIDEFEELNDRDISQIRRHASGFGTRSRISVIILPGRGSAKATWASLAAQLHAGFDVIATAPAPASIGTGMSVRVIAGKDRAPQAAVFNAGLAVAEGDYCLAIEAGDVLSPQALYRYAHAVHENAAVKLVYADEDQLSFVAGRVRPFFKPSWNAQLALAMDYVGRSALFRTDCLRALNGASETAGAAWRWDLLLRATEGEVTAAEVIRIPFVLLHRRKGDSWPSTAELADGMSAVTAALARRHVPASVAMDRRGWLSVAANAPDPAPRVSIIIPTRDRLDLLKPCIDSILTKTSYPDFDVTIVDNLSEEKDTIDYFESLKGHPRVSIVAWHKPFNFAALHNEVMPQTRGDVFAMLNNDTEVIRADWLERMVGFAVQPDVGIVGAKLYFPDDTVQHVGVVVSQSRLPTHAFVGRERADSGPHGILRVSREVTAVTGACMVMRRSVYDECGGFDEQYSSDYNDIDLCLKAGAHGYRVILAADAELYHHESATRNAWRGSIEYRIQEDQEHAAFRSRWLRERRGDPHLIPDTIEQVRESPALSGHDGRPWREGRATAEVLRPGVAIYGLFTSEIGIGQAARGLANALNTTTVAYSCHNLHEPRFSNSVQYPCEPDWTSTFRQQLCIFNPTELLNLKGELQPDRHRIGYWHWELPVFPALWAPAFDVIDEVWAPSRYVARSIAGATKKPVTIVPHAVLGSNMDKSAARDLLRLPKDAFIFLFVFDANSFIVRKNPTGAIRAYLDAFPEDAPERTILVIKSHGSRDLSRQMMAAAHGNPRIVVINRVFSPMEMGALTAAADTFVSLHRAEGFGLNIAEAMATGRLAIATDFSGNTDFMTADNSLLIPYKMRAVEPSDYICGDGQWWADPDHDAAVEAMRTAVRNETVAMRLAERGRRDMSEKFSPQAIGRKLKAALGSGESR